MNKVNNGRIDIKTPNTSTLFTDQGDFQPPISNIKNFTLFP